MKRKFKFLTYMVLSTMVALNLSSCDDDNEGIVDDSEKNQMLEAAATQFVNNTVITTYKMLADSTEILVDKLKTLKAEKSNANVQEACKVFLRARAQWEKSEAFLFGAASDFGIDPHIDSWPLDLTGFQVALKNDEQIAAMDAEDGDVYAGEKLGPALLGFHGIEYILFEDGHSKDASRISDKEMIYAVAVAGDLRNKCFQLQASWAGENGTKPASRYTTVVDDLEWQVTVNGGSYSYGENMLSAGVAGSTYSTWGKAIEAIIGGCKTIADEVGTSKIGKPHTGEDKNYIESPYSHNSITDFYDNIKSIENVYMGGIEGYRGSSIHDYIEKVNPELDSQIVAAIQTALLKIKAMKAPFVLNYTDASAQEAIDACIALDNILTSAQRVVLQ